MVIIVCFTNFAIMFFVLFLSEFEVELHILSGVREELEKMSSDKSFLQKELSNLEGKYKVMETLRDSQETELQTLKVSSLQLNNRKLLSVFTDISSGEIYEIKSILIMLIYKSIYFSFL